MRRVTWLPSTLRNRLRNQQPQPAVPASGWGNSAPLGLAAFAVTTFMLSMINAKLMPAAITPVVFGVALMFGGIAQLIAGVIQFRIGNAFTGVLFSTFGAFWLSLYAIAEFFLKDITATPHYGALRLLRPRCKVKPSGCSCSHSAPSRCGS